MKVSAKGRPPKLVTAQHLRTIEAMAGLGARLDDIAIALDISPSTLDRWLKDDQVRSQYEKGRIRATQAIAESLFSMAMAGEVAAAIFWLKAQAGWTDKPQLEQQASANVVVYLPDNGRGAHPTPQGS